MLVVDVILGVAVLALLIYRQLSVRPVNASALRLIAIQSREVKDRAGLSRVYRLAAC